MSSSNTADTMKDAAVESLKSKLADIENKLGKPLSEKEIIEFQNKLN